MDDQSIFEMASTVLEKESQAIAGLVEQLKPAFTQAVRILLNCEGHVLVGGAGTSHAVALRFAHLLSCCGTPALFLHPGDSQHGSAGAVRPQDVVVLLSKGGETVEVNFLARLARERGAFVIAITEKPASTLAGISNITLEVSTPENADPYGMIATGSSLSNSAFCDALCVVLLNLREYSQEQFGKTHPGGAVGKRLNQII